eukprot:2206133-Amphidinium_carterae.3
MEPANENGLSCLGKSCTESKPECQSRLTRPGRHCLQTGCPASSLTAPQRKHYATDLKSEP